MVVGGGRAAYAQGMEPVLVALMVLILLVAAVIGLYLLRKLINSQQDR